MNVILTNYFIGKPDPQRGIQHVADSPALVSQWVESVNRQKLNGVIFHDCLSDEFIYRYQSEHVKFLPYKLKTKWSVNDERFLCWLEWLMKNEAGLDRVFCVDLFDVTFHGSPFSIMTDEYDFYTGKVTDVKIKDRPYIAGKMVENYGEIHYGDRCYGSAGAFGGKAANVIKLIKKMVGETHSVNNREVDMAVFNKCMYDLFPEDKIFMGYPLTNKIQWVNGKGWQTVKGFENSIVRHK